MSKEVKKLKNTVGIMTLAMVLCGGILGFAAVDKLGAQEAAGQAQAAAQDEAASSSESSATGLGILGAGVAFGLAALGAGAAVGNASSAAIGAISEKPEMFSKSLIFVALGEGIMIIGFAMAFILLGYL
jgi:V/A-type H+-transporting ATPase subunit K